jgi:acetyl-CoA carboxylase carboxyltransferase component
MSWSPELEELEKKRALARQMGGAEGIARQHARGKLTVRERLDALFDPGSIAEFKSTLGESEYDAAGTLVGFRPGNSIAGYAAIDGRPVAWRGDDFTIRGGSSDAAGSGKRGIEGIAQARRIPLVRLLEGAGGSVREVAGGSNVTGGADGVARRDPARAGEALVKLGEQRVAGAVRVAPTFDERSITPVAAGPLAEAASGNPLAEIPVVSAVLGSCAGWIAIAAAQSHFSVMTRDTSELFVAGPPMIRQAQGREIDKHVLGSWKVHVQHTGVINQAAVDEADAMRQIRRWLSYLPSSVWELPPRVAPGDDPNRREEALRSIIPRDRRRVYDIRALIDLVVDRGSTFEIAPLFGRALVTMFARLDGFPVALMANDCRRDGGAMTPSACQKMERFVDIADAFHLPIVYLCDVPGFMIGVEAEQLGTLRWAARANQAVRESRVPFVSILMRRFYGVAMGGARGGSGAARYAWPSMESGSLPAAGGVMAAYRRIIEQSADPEAKRRELEERLNALASVLRRPQLVDEIIDPADTRPQLVDFVRQAQREIATQLGPKVSIGMRP